VKIVVTILTPDDYPKGRAKHVPKHIAGHLLDLADKNYVAGIVMSVDDGEVQTPWDVVAADLGLPV